MHDFIKPLVMGKGMFQENTYILVCQETSEAAIVDPGAFTPSEAASLKETLHSMGCKMKYIINTHGHLDHIAGNTAVKETTGALILVHKDDAEMLPDKTKNGSAAFGFNVASPQADKTLEDGDVIHVGKHELKVLHTPGHTPGGISLAGNGYVFTGDTLFNQSIGRTDLPGGSQEQELHSIQTKLLTLPEDTVVYPGHGPATTIGKEKRANPYLR